MKLKNIISIVLTIFVAIVIGVGIGVYTMENKYDEKESNTNLESNDDVTEENNDNKNDSDYKVDINEPGVLLHRIEFNPLPTVSSFGVVVVTNDGYVYYDPAEKLYINNEVHEFEFKNENSIGPKEDYKVKGYNEALDENATAVPQPFEAYKLNVTNVQAAYNVHFGNGGHRESVILVGKDGKISEFIIYQNYDSDGSPYFEMALFKNIEGYSDIVSVVPTASFGGNSALLIDKNGNYYNYSGKRL